MRLRTENCADLAEFLKAGESREVTLPICPNSFMVVNEDGEEIRGGDSFLVSVGVGQPDARTAALTGHEAVSIEVLL